MIKGKIENIAFGGSGIFRSNKLVIFVPFSAPEDEVTVAITSRKKNYSIGKILHLHEKSPYRESPKCPHYETCGGCQLQHLHYQAQLTSKQQFVKDALKSIICLDLPPIIPTSLKWGYRKHITVNLRKSGKGFIAGFIQLDNTSLLQIQACHIFPHEGTTIFKLIELFASKLSCQGIPKGSMRILCNQNKTYSFALTFPKYPPVNRKKVIEHFLRENKLVSSVHIRSENETESYGTSSHQMQINNLNFSYSPFGFLQNHLKQAEKMYYDIAEEIELLGSRVLDLYSGIGITSILLAKKNLEVIGIESDSYAVEMAKKNAAENAEPQIKFIHSSVEKSLSPTIKSFM
ncbi:MAG: class I SAM-dependent RNA methyltransferase, partial [Simkaniaceae bacterium]|nr:class I SAM-dependent RNA methyltransferase [Simkaniaceae bacterium]